MHSSVNVGEATTRRCSSASPAPARRRSRPIQALAHRRRRARLGADGLFNFEGGCYAKTIRLSPMYEPDIFATTRRFGTILENVDLDEASPAARPRLRALHREHARRLPARVHRQRRSDRDDDRIRATSSSSPPMPSASCRRSAASPASRRSTTSSAATPRSWPARRSASPSRTRRSRPASALRSSRAIPASTRGCSPSGSSSTTCRVAGEHRLDGRPVRRRRADADRPHPHMVRAALNGELADVPYERDPIFGVEVPTEVPGVPSEVLRPRGRGATRRRTTRRPPSWPRCSSRTSPSTPMASRPRCATRGRIDVAAPRRGGGPRARRSDGYEAPRRPRRRHERGTSEEEQLEPLLEQRLRRLDVGELLGQRLLRARRDDEHLLAGEPEVREPRASALT